MKKSVVGVIKALMFGFVIGGASGVYADAPALKIGVVNLQEIYTKAPQVEKAKKRLQKEFQGRRDELIEKQKKLQAQEEKLQRDREVLSENERKKTEKDINKQRQDLRRQNEELGADLLGRQQEENEGFSRTITDALNQIAAEEKYDLILPKEGTLVSNPSMDLTEKALKKLENAPETKIEKKDKKK